MLYFQPVEVGASQRGEAVRPHGVFRRAKKLGRVRGEGREVLEEGGAQDKEQPGSTQTMVSRQYVDM